MTDESMPKPARYSVRLREEDYSKNSAVCEAAKALGATTITRIMTYEVQLPSISEVLKTIAEKDYLKDMEIISIVLITSDNHELLNGDCE